MAKSRTSSGPDESASLITSILEDSLDFHFDNENEYREHIADRWDNAKE